MRPRCAIAADRHHCCPSAARPATVSFWGLPTLPDGGFNQEHARQAVQEGVDKATSETAETAPEVTVEVAAGEPTEELVASLPRR